MKYMILTYASQLGYDAMAGKDTGEQAWTPDDVSAMLAHMSALNEELVKRGEWVDGNGLSAPVHGRRVRFENGVPVVTDGPYAETQEVLAGYWVVECESFDRATEIAARAARCPTPGDGSNYYIDIRPVDGPDDNLEL